MKAMLLVGIGSFGGGCVRYLVSRLAQAMPVSTFPLGTFIVNVLGCLIIGYVSALPVTGFMTPRMKLLLTTGFCGGFTTFSTFMNETGGLTHNGDYVMTALYVFGSLAAGMAALLLGKWLAQTL